MKVIVMTYPEIIEDPTDSPFKVNRYVGVMSFLWEPNIISLKEFKFQVYFDINLLS